MKKLLPLFCALGFIAQPALAANNINALQNLGQPQFRALSEDLGSALSYKPVAPAASLGITGFDLGLEVTQTSMSKSSQVWATATGSGTALNNLYVPKLHIAKGLPFGIDVGLVYSKIPTTNISLVGGELKWAVIDGGVAMPAVAVRGAFTKLSGVNQLSFDTKSLDVSVSKGFVMFTPYAGVGQVWVNSAANVTGLGNVSLSEKFTQSKIFAGFNLNLGLANFALEADKTGGARSVTGKLGFRW
ncbi:MAG TPA: DUF6588 family protein [Gallionellaceae bacterium]